MINEEVTQQELLINNDATEDSNNITQDVVTFAVGLIENVFNDLQVFLENNTIVVYSNDIKSDLDHEVELYGQHRQTIEVI